MSFLVQSPFPGFEDVDGTPLEDGYIYIGTANLNPQSNPVAVFWDSALTQPAAQPIRTRGGYPARSGGPARIYTAANYSIMVKNKKDGLVFSELSAGFSSLTTGLLSGTITDLDFDPTLLGLEIGEVRILITNSSPANKPAGADTGTFYLVTLAKVSSSEYRVQVAQSGAMGSVLSRSYAAGVWGSWNANGQSPLNLTTGSSPYTLVAGTVPTILVSATTNPYVINLPQCSSSAGCAVDIVNLSQAIAGNVKIVPFLGDAIGPLAVDAPIYMNNVDQSVRGFTRKTIRVISDGVGAWSITGQWVPEPTLSTPNGGEYFLGSLVRYPLTNVLSRTIAVTPAAVGAWVLSASAGVPAGVKALLIRCVFTATVVAANTVYDVRLHYSDNQTSVPTIDTPHPMVYLRGVSPNVANGAIASVSTEMVIPLDTAGKFSVYTETMTGVSVGSIGFGSTVLGYYTGC